MIVVILGRLLNQDSLENTVKFSFTKLFITTKGESHGLVVKAED
jgi:hypothetical protein